MWAFRGRFRSMITARKDILKSSVSMFSSDSSALHAAAKLAWPADKEDKTRVVGSMGCLVASKVATVQAPLILAGLVNALGVPTTPETVAMGLVGSYFVARVSMSLFNELKNALFAQVSQRASRRLANETFSHLHKLDLDFLHSVRVGELSSISNRGVKASVQLLNMGVFQILPTTVEFGLVLYVLATNAGLPCTLMTIGTLMSYSAFTAAVTTRRVSFRKKMNEAEQRSNGLLSDSLVNAEAVRLFSNEKLESNRFDHALKDVERENVRVLQSLSVLNFGQQAIFNAGLLGVMGYTTAQVMAGVTPLGSLILVNSLLFQLAIPMNMIGTVYRETKLAIIDMEKVQKLLQFMPRCVEKEDAVDYVPKGGALTFENITFTYDSSSAASISAATSAKVNSNSSSEKRVLFDELNLSIKPGEVVGIVGPSGCGKSTLIKMALRMYDPDQYALNHRNKIKTISGGANSLENKDQKIELKDLNEIEEGEHHKSGGRVLLDGQDLRDLRFDSFRSKIGVIPQDVVLFNDSLRFNILYGRPDATEEELRTACAHAQLTDVISRLPNGLDSPVGERGLKLSGGEKQRVGIARCLLRNPEIVLLDEATSALDNATERLVMKSFRQVWKDKTAIIIAHRLTTVADADKIFHIKDGKVTESGSHDELIRKGGDYAKLWSRQNDNYIEELMETHDILSEKIENNGPK